jgi:cytochrome c-type biogenesis protein CcmH
LPISRLILVLCVFGATLAATPRPTQTELEEALTCQCGCGLTVHSCNHLQCGFAIPRKKEIAQFLTEGKGREDILAAFVTDYGEKVLSAPTTSGFNLVAWITPFAVILIGGLVIGVTSLRWARRRPPPAPRPGPAVSDAYRDQLNKELADFDA